MRIQTEYLICLTTKVWTSLPEKNWDRSMDSIVPLLFPLLQSASGDVLPPEPDTDLRQAHPVTWCPPQSENSPSAWPKRAFSSPSCLQWHWRDSLRTGLCLVDLESSRKASSAWHTPSGAWVGDRGPWGAHPEGSCPAVGAGNWSKQRLCRDLWGPAQSRQHDSPWKLS